MTCNALVAHGVTINRQPRDGRMAFLRTPVGISIELLQAGGALARLDRRSRSAPTNPAGSLCRHALAPPKTVVRHIPRRVVELVEDARRGDLLGEVILVEEYLHFCPAGYEFLVPVDETASRGIEQLSPGGHYRVRGALRHWADSPIRLVVDSAAPFRR
jgi:hypothetical protein